MSRTKPQALLLSKKTDSEPSNEKQGAVQQIDLNAHKVLIGNTVSKGSEAMETMLMQDWIEVPWMLADKRFSQALAEADPSQPATCLPGSGEKVSVLAARYAAGMPLWQNADKTDFSASTAKSGNVASSQTNRPDLRLYS